jgi:hypothetical protein
VFVLTALVGLRNPAEFYEGPTFRLLPAATVYQNTDDHSNSLLPGFGRRCGMVPAQRSFLLFKASSQESDHITRTKRKSG